MAYFLESIATHDFCIAYRKSFEDNKIVFLAVSPRQTQAGTMPIATCRACLHFSVLTRQISVNTGTDPKLKFPF